MSRDKKIREMTKDICEIQCNGMRCAVCDTGCDCRMQAEALYNAGYRKSEDVAEKIFAEIEEAIADLECTTNTPTKTVKAEELKALVNWVLHEVVPQTLAELKKKYTEEEK